MPAGLLLQFLYASLQSYSVGAGALARMVPSAFVTRAPNTVFDPSLAGLKSMVTVSPTLIELLLQPARSNTPGARSSMAHTVFALLPSSTFRPIQVCGLTHRNSVTTPVSVMILFTSKATLL